MSLMSYQHKQQQRQQQEEEATTGPNCYSTARRYFLETSAASAAVAASTSATFLLPPSALAFVAAAGSTSGRQRTVDAGIGGVDISVDTSTVRLSEPNNIVFPVSLEGTYSCQRSIVSIEGDTYQAETAWKALGGGSKGANVVFGVGKTPETYTTRFIASGNQQYAVLDRAFEWSSRVHSSLDATTTTTTTAATTTTNANIAQWNPNAPNVATLNGRTELAVIQRSVIEPNLDQGIVAGGQELVRIRDGPFTRAVIVKQRFRPSSSTNNSEDYNYEELEGLELVKTYRVLDGIAGTEFPTSTTKSKIKLKRIEGSLSSTTTDTTNARMENGIQSPV